MERKRSNKYRLLNGYDLSFIKELREELTLYKKKAQKYFISNAITSLRI